MTASLNGRVRLGWPVVVALVLSPATLFAQPAALRLTPDQVAAAIRAGIDHPIPTYSMRWRRPNVRTAATVGRAYTPWLRIALYARARADAGIGTTVDEVPDELTTMVVVVGFFQGPPMIPVNEHTANVEAIARASDDHARGIPPSWTRLNDAAWWDRSERPPFVIVAAFDPAVIRADTDIIFRVGTTLRFSVVRGTIAAEDVAQWR